MRNGGKKRSGRLIGAADTSEKLTKLHVIHQKNLNKLGQPNRKSWYQHRKESCQGR